MDLGDVRRDERLVRMAACAATHPSGKISEVFSVPKERQGAYDFLESGHAKVEQVMLAAGRAAATRAAAESLSFAAIDGSSLSLADRAAEKKFGSVGTVDRGGRGLKVISALAISLAGVQLGLLTQVWWARTESVSEATLGKKEKRKRRDARDVTEKESRHWLEAIRDATARANETTAKLWFLLDREGDSREVLRELLNCGHLFSVRSCWDRRLDLPGKETQYLRQHLSQMPAVEHYPLQVSSGSNRTARKANMALRFATVEFSVRNRQTDKRERITLNTVWTREEGTCPEGEEPLDWLLLTNATLNTAEDARFVVHGYSLRWRIEDFHRTWKRGACAVELTQLRTQASVCLWATLLATVATRIERLKVLSRTTPDQPACLEYSPHEIQAALILKRTIKKRTETIPKTPPTLGQITLWIAELGGYTGKSSGGPPGSTTIQRGMLRVSAVAAALQVMAEDSEPTSPTE